MQNFDSVSQPNKLTVNKAFFANRDFFLHQQDDGAKFLLWRGNSSQNSCMLITATHSIRWSGAFLCKIQDGWLLVGGTGNNLRHTFLDDSIASESNATSVSKLGIPIVSIEEANMRIKSDGDMLYSITAEEKDRKRKLEKIKMING